MRRRENWQRTAILRRLYALCGAVAGLAIVAAGATGPSQARAQSPAGPHAATFATALRYVETFYPRWFTYQQSQKGISGNQLVGPDNITVPDFAIPFKGTADGLIANDAIEFLKQLQEAVESPTTPPLTRSQQALADTFNRLFGDGTFNPDSPVDQGRKSDFILGAQSAHTRILNNYLTHTGRTNWITFTNIGNWGRNYLDRSSITEFCQYCNNHSAAAYFHAFKDGQGATLDASAGNGYILTFSKKQIPQANRFWSVTAYVPESIELVENPDNKYVVASYTPNLMRT